MGRKDTRKQASVQASRRQPSGYLSRGLGTAGCGRCAADEAEVVGTDTSAPTFFWQKPAGELKKLSGAQKAAAWLPASPWHGSEFCLNFHFPER